MTSRRWIWLVVALVAVTVIAGSVVFALTRPAPSTSSPSTGSAGAGAPAYPGAGQSGGAPGPGASKAATPAAEPATQTADGTWVVTPKSGGAPVKVDATFYVRVFFWNDTQGRPPRGCTVRWGASGSWSPDVSRPSQVTTIGPFPVGRQVLLAIQPDGPTGSSAAVPIVISDAMRSGSDTDGIHVEVSDGLLRVLGNPVVNFEATYPRP